MNTKRWICLGLFLLPMLGMLMVLKNFIGSDTEMKSKDPEKTVAEKITSGNKRMTDDGWITEVSDGKEITYRFGNSFSKCDSIDELIQKNGEQKVSLPNQEVTRVAFLKTILTAHCIDYRGVDVSDLEFIDIEESDTETKEIIKASMILGVSNGYEVDGEKEFRANVPVTKIEALTMLIKLSDLKIQNEANDYEFKDVKRNWKSDIANISAHLGLARYDAENNKFFPDIPVTREMAGELLTNITKYYR